MFKAGKLCYFGSRVRFLFGSFLTSVIFIFLWILFPGAASHFVKAAPLLIVSFDGFRWDYLSRTATPNFDHVIETGVYASKGLSNVFTTSTLTNHWSIVTGLYAESHGIIDNIMYDPELNETYVPLYKDKYAINNPKFYDTGAEPIWVTNQLQKAHGRSGSVMWWGAENVIKSTRPTYHMPFSYTTSYTFRIDTMINWFTSRYPINLGLLYFNEPDHTAHACGPESENVTMQIAYADNMTGYLFKRLKEEHLYGHINVIITSDHGFTSTSRKRLIHLDDIVDPSLYRAVHYSPVATLIPNEGQENFVYEKLKEAEATNNYRVFKKADIPDDLHYKHNKRVTPIVAIANLSYSFISRMSDDEFKPGQENFVYEKLKEAEATNNYRVFKKADIPDDLHYKHNKRVTPIVAIANLSYSFISRMSDDEFKPGGTHGYDNKEQAMHPFFMATGPAFKSGFQVETFQSVDLYPLMCHLLDLEPAPNNGSMKIVSRLLREEHETTMVTLVTYLICLIVIATFGGVFSVAACRNRRYLKRTSRPINVSEILSGHNGAHIGLLSGDEDDEF
ncbi:ectonucleotide pyrophosphatase/phosphodiesterase family member 5 [Plakobranchus ocellatus]|uniref:Ectonucleotide pyrophosphatase/phosphodiesterase family member 5 n=1 Tax=Plakobranchus ocellatus TaxID=259542 RepID=A0AAV4DHA2_9GAST|nr:ectonucleotide pyrophosphatase/phosphodiesterase family member 5 [Plakobranchus ocellatus]